MKNSKIRLLLVDDQKLFVENLKVILEMSDPALEVIAIAENGSEAVEAAQREKPDIILMDVRMPVMDGVEATRIIHDKFPDIKIMMLTTFDDDVYVHDALANGAAGYILKNTSSENLVQGIKALNLGQGLITPSLISRLVSSGSEEVRHDRRKTDRSYNLDLLSSRERDVLFLLSRGYDNQEIGDRLFIALQTVKNHISHIYDKLEIHDRMSAMKAAGDPRLKEWCRHLMDD
ncbi:MAG: response regulator transcription factor [Spirochaetales bacterium]|nr:response regulator transcription factor [Spirochaetales bacterium]